MASAVNYQNEKIGLLEKILILVLSLEIILCGGGCLFCVRVRVLLLGLNTFDCSHKITTKIIPPETKLCEVTLCAVLKSVDFTDSILS
jgi:hypothetical protein